MKRCSLSTWFPNNFISILTILQSVQEHLSRHAEIDDDFNDQMLTLFEKMVEMTVTFEAINFEIPTYVSSPLKEQIVKMNKYGVKISSKMLHLKNEKPTRAEHNFLKMKINGLLKFWRGQATSGIRASENVNFNQDQTSTQLW